MTKRHTYSSYMEEWDAIMQEMIDIENPTTIPQNSIQFNFFIRYWEKDIPLLRIASRGLDF